MTFMYCLRGKQRLECERGLSQIRERGNYLPRFYSTEEAMFSASEDGKTMGCTCDSEQSALVTGSAFVRSRLFSLCRVQMARSGV